MTDYAFASAKRLAGLIRRKKIGALELLDHYLARVERYNPTLNAIVATDIPGARKRARAADRALAKGEVWGPFHGIPITIKEAIDVKGLPTTWGVPAYKDNIAATNAVVVDRWLDAGAIVFGKTNVPLWVADGHTFNDIYGITRNPWNTERTPGGSSGGASAAVAAGLSAIETGSDIASSIRNPAHYTGIWGHKPTYGLIPQRGHAVNGRVANDDINVIGPLARSAEDLELALNALAGPEEIEAVGMHYKLPAPRKTALKDFKVAVVVDDPIAEVDSTVQNAISRLADFLGKRKAKVSMTARPEIDMKRMRDIHSMLLRAATSHRQTEDQFADALLAVQKLAPEDDSLAARVLRGNTLFHRDWHALDEERQRLRWVWHEFFKDYDVLLCPVLSTAAPPIDTTPSAQRLLEVNGRMIPYGGQLFWAGYTNIVYLPSTAAPIGFTSDGLPIGVQIAGPHFGDRTTIHFAKLLEAEYQGFAPPPDYR